MTQHDTSLSYPAEPMPARNGRERLEPLQVTIAEAARLLAYDTRTIRRLIIRGEIPAVGEGRLRRIPLQGPQTHQPRLR